MALYFLIRPCLTGDDCSECLRQARLECAGEQCRECLENVCPACSKDKCSACLDEVCSGPPAKNCRPCTGNNCPGCSGEECSGGATKGITMGFLGFALILGSMAYTLRKEWPKVMVLPLEQWLYFHVVVGTLSLILIIGHSGFYLRNLGAALALLFLAITVVSGVVGLFIIYFMPRKQARHEVAVLIPDDLLKRISRLNDEILELCSEKGGIFLVVYNELVIPLYQAEVGKQPPSVDVSPWADRIPEGGDEDFMMLASKIEEAHDLFVLLGRHMRFRWWIRGWLLLHVPSTIGLVVFSIVHIISMTWYGMR